MLPATRRSFGLTVVMLPLELVALFPVSPPAVSSGLSVSRPEYSRMRISGNDAEFVKVTVTALPPAAAEAIFFA